MVLRNSAKKEFALHLTKLMSWRNHNEIERTQLIHFLSDIFIAVTIMVS